MRWSASWRSCRSAGLIEQSVAPGHAAGNAHFQKTQVKVDWQFMVLVGILIGAIAASRLDGSFLAESSPPIWRDRFGPKVATRAGSSSPG